MADGRLLTAESFPVYRIEPMVPDDVPEVSRVERRCFSNPWPAAAYRRELRLPEQNAYVVLRHYPDAPPAANGGNGGGKAANGSVPWRPEGPRPLARLPLLPFGRRPEPSAPRIVGFAGMWTMFDEAHITTIGVDPAHRGRGLGELLLLAMFDEALRRGANWLTLEVRVSNEPAQALYRKYGFSVHGTRRRYYSDNNEDAHVMWSRSLQDAPYRVELAALRQALFDRLRLAPTGAPLPVPDEQRSPAGG